MRKFLKGALLLIIAVVTVVLGINFIVMGEGAKAFTGEQDVKKADCILVLGAEVKPDGSPSKMLRDRLEKGIELYNAGAAPKLLLSGDNGQVEYNEVKTMLAYAKEAGVPEEDIFLDHAGFSTYESIYRARDVFRVSSMIIVTQKYHEYRALYIAKKLGVDAQGANAEDIAYAGQSYRDIREILARDKDFLKCITKPEPTFLGEPIDITGDGRQTQ